KVAGKKNEIAGLGLRQHILAGIVRSDGRASRMMTKRKVRTARRPHENRFARRMRRRQIDDARDKTVRMGMERLVSSGLEHVRPHLLDGPMQFLAKQKFAEIDQLRGGDLGDRLKDIVLTRIRDLGMEQLTRAQIALGAGVSDRRNGGVLQLRAQKTWRAH